MKNNIYIMKLFSFLLFTATLAFLLPVMTTIRKI